MSTTTSRPQIVRSYFALLTASDVVSIVALFAEDGFVESPVLGRMPAGDFYRTLDDASTQKVLTVHRVLSSDDNRVHAAHFTYDWTLAKGGQIEFDGVDLFEFNDDDKIVSMKIFYDTHPTREVVGNKYERPPDHS